MRARSALWRNILLGLGCVLVFGAQGGPASAAQATPAAALALVATAEGQRPGIGLESRSQIALALSFWPNAAPSLLLQADTTPRLLLPPMTERPLAQLAALLADWRAPKAAPRCAAKEALLKALDELGRLLQKPRLAVLLLNDPEAAPCGLAADAFRDAESRLLVIGDAPNAAAAAWQELATQSGGHYKSCFGANDADSCLVEALKLATPALEAVAPYFSVDTGTTKVSLWVHTRRGVPVKVQVPNGPALDLTSRISLPGARETLALPLPGGYLLTVSDPPAGAWQLQNIAGSSLALAAEQRQSLELVLPRTHFLDSESLPLAVYHTADGRIAREQRKLKDVGCEARLFGLAALSGAALAGAPLLDDGKAPDKVAGDGVYSGAVPLKGLLGPLTLDVSCQSSLFIGHVKHAIDVRHGDFLRRENDEAPLTADKAETLSFAAEALPESGAEGPLRYFMQLADEEPQALAEALGKPGHFVGRLIPLGAVGVYPLSLIALRSESPLLDDRQQTLIKLRVVPDAEKQTTRRLLFVGLGLFALLVLGAAFVGWRILRKARKDAAEPALLEVPKAESLSEKPKAPEPESAFMRIEEGDDVELPSGPEPAQPQSKVFVEDVSKRIGEVVSVHAAEPIKGELERPTLDEQSLDNDGDSSRVSGLMMEKVKTWLDQETPEEPAKGPAKEPAAPQEEGAFKGLNSDDMDEIFGAKKPPAGRSDADEKKKS